MSDKEEIECRVEIEREEMEFRDSLQEQIDSLREMVSQFSGYVRQSLRGREGSPTRFEDAVEGPAETQSLHTVREGSSQGSVANRTGCLGKLAKLSNFSGADSVPQGEVCYEQYLFELENKSRRLGEQDLQSAMIGSLKGSAAALIRRLGAGATSEQMKEALVARYGPSKPLSALRSELYSTKQEKKESFQSYVDRVEEKLAIYKQLGGWSGTRVEEENHLKGIVYEGLKGDLKASLRYTERDQTITYREFQRIAKMAEGDLKGSSASSVSSKSATQSTVVDVGVKQLTSKDWDDLNRKFEELTQTMMRKIDEHKSKSSFKPYCHFCKKEGHMTRDCKTKQLKGKGGGLNEARSPPKQQ